MVIQINGKARMILAFLLSVVIIIALSELLAATPNGATASFVKSTRYNPGNGTTVSAIAGNITEVFIDGVSLSSSWHGYYGNEEEVITRAVRNIKKGEELTDNYNSFLKDFNENLF